MAKYINVKIIMYNDNGNGNDGKMICISENINGNINNENNNINQYQ